MDGQWHRLKVDGDRTGTGTGKSGAYIGHLDGVPRGTVKTSKLTKKPTGLQKMQ